ncbi:MAG: LPS-assembly protein LptD [Rhizobiaceae bacterium]
MGRWYPASRTAPEKGSSGRAVPKIAHFAVLLALGVSSPALLSHSNLVSTAQAQEQGQTAPDAQLFLTADELIYDNDNETVTARGNVQLEYDGRNVVADQVSYNQATRRVRASGNVEILEPSGNRTYAQEIDITDDFGVGFVNALRVETADNTRIAAESAERFADQKTVFHHGVYTACEPCRENPDRAPMWQVKAQKVILDGVEKTVTYKHARFELWGLPIAYFPWFSHPDDSVKRKSGFLLPQAGSDSRFGYWGKQSYFLVTGDSHDVTLTATQFTGQGTLAEARWRHQMENGFYDVTIAGISQNNRDDFAAGSTDASVTDRGMLGSHGRFDINPRWTFGWDVLVQSDSSFSRTYQIDEFTNSTFTNQAFLEGLHDRSFFNLSAKRYLVQNNDLTASAQAFSFESKQPTVLPTLDYNYVRSEDLTGGELSLDVNLATVVRTEQDLANTRVHGIDGESGRATADLGWKKKMTTAGGLSFTPSLSLRGDWINTRLDTAVAGVTTGNSARFMPTAGLEVSYPVLAQNNGSSHIFEPVAQLFVRPDLAFSGVLPNEDAQSMVFDASTLFQRDKFSGYDRIESGTRANLGLRYSGQFNNGMSLNGVFGQSYHIAGDNPYARTDDLVNAGENSGLENHRSDFVASLSLITDSGFTLSTQGRFDEDDFEVQRTDTTLAYTDDIFSLAANYTFIDTQPQYASTKERQQVGFRGKVKLTDNWDLFAGAQYNIESGLLISDSVGLNYHDECFNLTLAFNESRSDSVSKVNQSVTFKFSLRTIGGYQGSVDETGFQ